MGVAFNGGRQPPGTLLREGTHSMVTRTTKTVLAGLTVLAVAGLGSGIAYAQDGGNAPAPPSNSPAPPSNGDVGPDRSAASGKHHRNFLGRIEHGEFTVRAKDGDRVIDVQRGTVTAVDGQSLTVKSEDGFSGTYTVDQQTKVHKSRKSATIGQVATNDRVMVFAEKNGGTDVAKRIGDAGPAK
jgi:hypothetical protein